MRFLRPRSTGGLVLRFFLLALLVVGSVAATTAVAGLLQVQNLVNDISFNREIKSDQIKVPAAGAPQTILLIGSDHRAGEPFKKANTDTMLLVHLDSASSTINVMSLPRDLKVSIPGFRSDKINAAYADGGPRKSVATIKRLFRNATGEDFPINNVINVTFGGFRRAVNYVGGVYVDVDRRYYNDNTTALPGQNYATIDVQPGYQKLEGQDALDYVRYRHGDSDFFRGARQQDFLRQAAAQDGVRKLLDFGARNRLAHIFGRYFEVDKSFLSAGNLIGLMRMGVFLASRHAPVNEVRFPAIVSPDPTDTYLSYKAADVKKAADQFMAGAGSANPKPAAPKSDTAFKRITRKRTKPSSIAGLEQASSEGVNLAVLADPKLSFPFYFPALRVTGSRYTTDQARLYDIVDEQGNRHQAFRLVLYTGDYGEYYGVQGMTWRYPPILDKPEATRTLGRRRRMLFYDGSHLRLVAWRTAKAVYWVTNTLDLAIDNRRLLAIAESLKRLNQ